MFILNIWYNLINWLEKHQGTCFYKKYFEISCPGCGMQTAFIKLLQGNIIDSIKAYPPLLPIIFMFLYLILHLKFKYTKGHVVLKFSFIFTVIIIIINYVIKF